MAFHPARTDPSVVGVAVDCPSERPGLDAAAPIKVEGKDRSQSIAEDAEEAAFAAFSCLPRQYRKNDQGRLVGPAPTNIEIYSLLFSMS